MDMLDLCCYINLQLINNNHSINLSSFKTQLKNITLKEIIEYLNEIGYPGHLKMINNQIHYIVK